MIDVRQSDQRLRVELHARGQRVTPQRVLIHRALLELGRHSSAEEVLGRVSDSLPGASLPTVYSTLELFERLGIVRRLSARGGATLYDPRRDPHHHLVCSRCGKVEDLDVDVDASGAVRQARRAGFQPAAAELVVTGLCSDCAERQASQ
jgi:Fe2+ or Zn2+ uptake regulation protein